MLGSPSAATDLSIHCRCTLHHWTSDSICRYCIHTYIRSLSNILASDMEYPIMPRYGTLLEKSKQNLRKSPRILQCTYYFGHRSGSVRNLTNQFDPTISTPAATPWPRSSHDFGLSGHCKRSYGRCILDAYDASFGPGCAINERMKQPLSRQVCSCISARARP